MRKEKITTTDAMRQLSDITDLLTDAERALLQRALSVQRLAKGQAVYAEGDLPQHLCCLLSGKVKIFKQGTGGRTQITRMVKPVDYFGCRAYFAGQNHISAATAVEASTIVRIPMDTVYTLMAANVRLSLFFVRQLAIVLGHSDQRTVSLTQKHIRARLAEALLFLRDAYGLEADRATLSIYLSREDLANLSNMTTANAIRTLSTFAAEDLIAIDGRKIKLINSDELAKISKLG